MKMKSEQFLKFSLLFLVMFLLLPGSAFAYVGPGAGLGMIGSLIAVVVVVLAAVLGLVIFPLRMIMKKKKEDANKDD